MHPPRLLVLCSLLLLQIPALAETADGEPAERIVFKVNGLKSARGSLRCALYSEGSWLKTAVRSTDGRIDGSSAVCEFEDVPPGIYGISSYHDENDNGLLDSNFLRIPKEDYAASNDARSSFGPPKFKDARFTYEGGLLELEARMR